MTDEKSVWLYRSTESGLWTVGFFCPDGKWEPESDHDNEVSAANRVHYLNGGPQKTVAQKSSRDWTEMLNIHAGKIQKENAEIEARVGAKIPKMIDKAFSEPVSDEKKSVEDGVDECMKVCMFDHIYDDESIPEIKYNRDRFREVIRRIQAEARRDGVILTYHDQGSSRPCGGDGMFPIKSAMWFDSEDAAMAYLHDKRWDGRKGVRLDILQLAQPTSEGGEESVQEKLEDMGLSEVDLIGGDS